MPTENDARRSRRLFWENFPGCAWCSNTRRVVLDRERGEQPCPWCRGN